MKLKLLLAGVCISLSCANFLSAQDKDLLFSPEGIAEIHITLADGKTIDDIKNEKQDPANYPGKIKATMTVNNSAASTYASTEFYTGNILIDGRGNTSWNRAKRPYNIDFVGEDWETANPAALLGMPACDEWALLNFWVDRSLMRIPLAFYLGQHMNGMAWTPRGRYVEVWINDDYRGLYFVSEKVQRDDNRIDIKKLNAESTDLSGGYILEATPRDGGKSTAIETATQIQSGGYDINFVFKYPKPKNVTNDQRMWIKNYLDEFENTLRGSNYQDPENGYQKYINEESFIDWTILHELSKGVDNLFHASVFVHKDRNGKLNMSAPWDFDLSFCNSGVYTEEGNWVKTHRWFGRLNQDNRYAQKFIARYEEFLPLFNQIPEILQANYQQLEEAGVLEREHQKYPKIIDEFVSDGEGRRTPTTYKGHVQFLNEWTMSRNNWVYINLGITNEEKGQRMKQIHPVIRIMDPEAVEDLRSFEVKVMRSEDSNNNKYTYSWNDGSFENVSTRRIAEKGKYWVKIKDEWGNVSQVSDTLYFGIDSDDPVIYWTATASSSSPGDEPYRAIDKDLNTRWSSGAAQTGNEWFIVNMQDLQIFNTIVLNQSGAPGDYPRLCDIYVSNDGLNWGNPVVTVSGMTEDEMRIRLPKVYSARYVKITQNRESNSGSWWAINEFSVDNVTYDGWFAAASSSGSGHNASNAVDNDPNSSWNSGAAQTGNEWFTVDLLKKTTFNSIVLNQEGSEDDYPREYAVYGSEDGVTWPTRSLVTGNGTPGKETRIAFTRKWGYRYLKIAQTGQSEGSWWSIYNLSVEISTAISNPEINPLQIRYSEGRLKIENALPDSQLTIYSLSGQTVKQETNVTGTIEVNLPQGIYLVTVRDKYRVCTEKLIIK